jgi:hypothetical protein
VGNNGIWGIDILGKEGCTPPKIKDPVQTESCNATATTKWKAIEIAHQTNASTCLGLWNPLGIAGCMFAAKIIYIAQLYNLKREWNECLDSVSCVCPVCEGPSCSGH